jgi:hypothetical protein
MIGDVPDAEPVCDVILIQAALQFLVSMRVSTG